jgi:hypothetical protein
MGALSLTVEFQQAIHVFRFRLSKSQSSAIFGDELISHPIIPFLVKKQALGAR